MFRASVASTTRDTHPKGARGLPCVWRGAIRAILLDVHPKEAHIHSINFLKGKECFGSIRERFRHFPRIHKPEIKEPDVCMHHHHLQSALQTRPAAVNPLSAKKLEARSPLLTTGPELLHWPRQLGALTPFFVTLLHSDRNSTSPDERGILTEGWLHAN